ncbi:MAG: tetraacyldisaccharide 4'-kinase [Phycisphaerales bacterium]
MSPMARVAAVAYGAAVRGMARTSPSLCAPIPVIAVGNITAGGTGKTPVVRWCAQWLVDRGLHPVVALRGYRARHGQSDEAMEYQALLPGVPVAVGPNRAESIQAALATHPQVNCAVLDDAFQHRRLARELDIVLVDATRPGLEGPLLPAGWLREPASGLQRAGVVVVTRARAVDPALSALIERWHGRPPAAWCTHTWSQLDVFTCAPGQQPVHRSEPLAALRGRPVVAAAALGNPQPFLDALRESGARVRAERVRRDHAPYGPAEAAALRQLAAQHQSWIATTWKDWTKLGHALSQDSSGGEVTVVVPRVQIGFLAGQHEIEASLAKAVATARR